MKRNPENESERAETKLEINNKGDDGTSGRWTTEEHLIFLKGLQKYGKQWRVIQRELKTRTSSQIRTHAQKFFLRMREILKVGDEEVLQYVKRKDPELFLSDSKKYAKLALVDPVPYSEPQEEEKQPESASGNAMSVANKREEPEPALVQEEELPEESPEGEEVIRPIATHSAQLPPIHQVDFSPLATIIDQNMAMQQILSQKRDELKEFCDKTREDLSQAERTQNEAEIKNARFLHNKAATFQKLLTDLLESHIKNSALTQYLLLQTQITGLMTQKKLNQEQ